MAGARTLGITVMPEWIQVEGSEPLLDNLARAGATAVATSPYVMAPADPATGTREPPQDAGAGKVRLLDRALWGRRELFVRTAPSFAADPSLYRGLRYQPPPADALTEAEGAKVAAFVAAAKARGLEVWLQVQAAIPPGYRVQFGGPIDEDEPRLPDGSAATGRVDRNASLASPEIRAYGCALLKDLARAYPTIDGFRIDWPEYPPYAFEALFFDFSAHAMRAAVRLGYDAERMRRDTAALRETLTGGLSGDALDAFAAAPAYHAGRALARFPGVLDLLRLKADLVVELLQAYREAMPVGMKLVPQAFPPPWSLLSGFDYGRVGGFADGIGVKLYTMHWPMMLRFWGEAMAAAEDGPLARALAAFCDTGGPTPASVADFRYPEPDEPHPVGAEAQSRKIRTAQAEAGACPVFAFAHAYGPPDDFERRARIAWEASRPGIWVNRYGYLADAKLDALGRVARGG